MNKRAFLNIAGCSKLSGRHRGIASLVFFASWERIAEDFCGENAHRQDFCIASHRHFRAYPAPPLTSHRCPHRAIWATQVPRSKLDSCYWSWKPGGAFPGTERRPGTATNDFWGTDLLPLLVLTRRGRKSTGKNQYFCNNFPRKCQRIPRNYYQYWC